jgi:hypothetical protein
LKAKFALIFEWLVQNVAQQERQGHTPCSWAQSAS